MVKEAVPFSLLVLLYKTPLILKVTFSYAFAFPFPSSKDTLNFVPKAWTKVATSVLPVLVTAFFRRKK